MEQQTKSKLEYALNVLFSVTHHSDVSICRYCLVHIEDDLDKRATMSFDTFPHHEDYGCIEEKKMYEKYLRELRYERSSVNYLTRAIETALECEDSTMVDDLLRACVEKVKENE